MILNDSPTADLIDEKIKHLQRQLADLYEHRQLLVQSVSVVPTKSSTPTISVYRELLGAWKRLGVTIPSYLALKPKLVKAIDLRDKLNNFSSDGQYSIVLVPPSENLGHGSLMTFRSKLLPPQYADYIDPNVSPKKTTRWQVLVVLTSVEGLGFDNLEDPLAGRGYPTNSKDGKRLGVYEYMAMTLQCDLLFDITSWTVLLKDYQVGDQPVCARFSDNRYRFEVDDLGNVLGDNRFRPAFPIS